LNFPIYILILIGYFIIRIKNSNFHQLYFIANPHLQINRSFTSLKFITHLLGSIILNRLVLFIYFNSFIKYLIKKYLIPIDGHRYLS
jgi:hypothetical protein